MIVAGHNIFQIFFLCWFFHYFREITCVKRITKLNYLKREEFHPASALTAHSEHTVPLTGNLPPSRETRLVSRECTASTVQTLHILLM